MAKRKRASEAEQRPAPIRWEFDPAIPTEDFFERADLTDPLDLQEAINRFVCWLEEDRFLTWEAVECYEQGQPLTTRQEKALSFPPGVNSPPEAIPTELRHKLWLQYCLDSLSGLGQSDELNLQEQPWRIDELIERLRECQPVVESMSLTLDSLLTRVILPARDQPTFVATMREKLGLESGQDRIADHL